VAEFDEEKELGKQYAELFPGPDDHLKNAPPTAAPEDEEGRRIHDLYNELFPPQKEGVTNMTPDQKGRVDQALADAQWSDEISGAQEKEQRGRRQRELDAHERLMAHDAASASRDVLHDNGPGRDPGEYTVHEARDRAAHTPAAPAREPER
jgi:hypothetical protein